MGNVEIGGVNKQCIRWKSRGALCLLQTAIEHHLVPRMMAYILPYIRDQERDKKIRQQCDQFANITLEQLG